VTVGARRKRVRAIVEQTSSSGRPVGPIPLTVIFFRKASAPPSPEPPAPASDPDVRPISSAPSAAARAGAVAPSAESAASEVGLLLDTIGHVLGVLARTSFDLPERPAVESYRIFNEWQRHATLGVPREHDGDAVGVRDRDWDGVRRAITEHRRDEQRHVETAIGELRDALWACIEGVHRAIRIEQSADKTSVEQVDRARRALERLSPSVIKTEVLSAVAMMEKAMQVRQEQHQKEYQTLAGTLDKVGRQLEDAKKETTTDPLTGLGNRKLFDTVTQRSVHVHSLSRQPITLVMIDLDKLKLLNDTYGHRVGDAAIQGIAKAMTKVFLRQTDTLCRFGGDEFAAVLSNTDAATATTLCNRLAKMIGEMPNPDARMEFKVGASMGVAQLKSGEEVSAWLERADRALYKAKQSGRGRVSVADE
jgi:diguanylate cyclase (GGDEF)-like protein